MLVPAWPSAPPLNGPDGYCYWAVQVLPLSANLHRQHALPFCSAIMHYHYACLLHVQVYRVSPIMLVSFMCRCTVCHPLCLSPSCAGVPCVTHYACLLHVQVYRVSPGAQSSSGQAATNQGKAAGTAGAVAGDHRPVTGTHC
jgi:hypothetical protein